MCVARGKSFFVLAEPVTGTLRFVAMELYSGLKYELDLKLRFGLIEANLECLDSRVAIIGRNSQKLIFLLVDTAAGLNVMTRARVLIQLDLAGIAEMKFSTARHRVFITLYKPQTSYKYEFWTVNKNGINKLFFRGSPDTKSDDSLFPLTVTSTLSSAVKLQFKLQIYRKVYNKPSSISGGQVARYIGIE